MSDLYCIYCGSDDVEIVDRAEYNELTLEKCFILYYGNKAACVCDGDKKQVIFEEE